MQTAHTTTSPDRLLAFLLGGVAFAAGLTGLVLLAAPGDSATYFSWGLDPPPLAAFIGGSYLASLLVFGLALRRSWNEVRGLVIGTLALTLPILASTFTHLGAFDFGRWQAWGWVVLFIASPLFFGAVLWQKRGAPRDQGDMPLDVVRWLAAVLAGGLFCLAVLLWFDPRGAGATVFPFSLPPLGGRVLGCWLSFLAFLGAWTATHSRRESRMAALGLMAFSAGALIGALRTYSDLQPGLPYSLVLAGMTVVTGWVWWQLESPS